MIGKEAINQFKANKEKEKRHYYENLEKRINSELIKKGFKDIIVKLDIENLIK